MLTHTQIIDLSACIPGASVVKDAERVKERERERGQPANCLLTGPSRAFEILVFQCPYQNMVTTRLQNWSTVVLSVTFCTVYVNLTRWDGSLGQVLPESDKSKTHILEFRSEPKYIYLGGPPVL